MAENTCWLVERADPNNPRCVLPNSFLGVAGSYDGLYASGSFVWLDNAHEALRFMRQKDAAQFVAALSTMQDDLRYRETITGLRSGDIKPIIVEHVFEMVRTKDRG